MASEQFKNKAALHIFFVWVAVCIGSGYKALPRLFSDPSPYSQSRYHHEYGDGGTETTILDGAHKHWNIVGYWRTTLLPCLDPDKAGEECAPYTHYPPVPFLASSLLIKAFGDGNAGLIGARLFVFAITTIIFALALHILAQSFNVSLLFTIAIALLTASRRGFWVYTDNLFFLGIVTAISALCLAYIIKYLKNRRSTLSRKIMFNYGLLAGLMTWLSWEPLPAITLYPLLSFFYLDLRKAWMFSLKMCATALLGSGFTLVLRIAQNAIALGGINAVIADWTSIATKRQGVGMTVSVAQWFLSNIGQYKVLLGYIGIAALVISAAILLFRKKYKEVVFSLAAAIMVLSWNLIMIEHSGHGYTHRVIVIVFALILLIASSTKRPQHE